jgi:hypothetical protein
MVPASHYPSSVESARGRLQMSNQTLASAVAAAAVVAALALAPGSAAGQTKTPDIHGYFSPDAPDASHSLEEGAEPENTLGRGRGRTRAQIEEDLKNRRVLIVDPAPGPKIPYQPWARAKQRELLDALVTPTKITDIEPEDRCAPMGVPRINYRQDFEIDQSPRMVTILYSWNHAYRMIPLDGRPHLPASIKLFNGDSRGHWEGNTLVVDVTNLNDQTWFDAHGTIHTDGCTWSSGGPSWTRTRSTTRPRWTIPRRSRGHGRSRIRSDA